MTEAAKKIRETDEKIIEIAFEYDYDSPDSFGLAFKNFHGYTPSEVRKGKPFRAISRVRLMLTVKGGNRTGINVNGGDFLNSNRVTLTTERLNMEKDNLKLIDVT